MQVPMEPGGVRAWKSLASFADPGPANRRAIGRCQSNSSPVWDMTAALSAVSSRVITESNDDDRATGAELTSRVAYMLEPLASNGSRHSDSVAAITPSCRESVSRPSLFRRRRTDSAFRFALVARPASRASGGLKNQSAHAMVKKAVRMRNTRGSPCERRRFVSATPSRARDSLASARAGRAGSLCFASSARLSKALPRKATPRVIGKPAATIHEAKLASRR